MRTCLAALALLMCPAAAGAATARVDEGRVHFVAAPGEANDVSVAASGGQITLTDTAAQIAAQDGCAQVDAHSVTCTASGLWAELGDGDDTVRSPVSDDILDGGEGTDTLSYEGREDDIRVDLEKPTPNGHFDPAFGADIDEDTLSGFENVTGGSAQDALYGDPGDNVLVGGDTGADDLGDSFYGREGDDTLIAAGRGASFSGGRGDDVLVGNAGRDHFTCGTGDDAVEQVTMIDDFVSDGCELLRNRKFSVEPGARPVGTRALRYVLHCAGECEGSIIVRRQRRNRPEHRLLGRARFAGAGRVTVRVPLTPLGRAFRRDDRRPIIDTYVYGVRYTAWSTQLPAD